MFHAALQERKTIAYARVSSHDQKDDLERQKQVLELYCAKKGLKRLLDEIIEGRVGRLVVAHKDRLLRFTGKTMSATVSRVADKWFVSVTVDTLDSLPLLQAKNQGAVGVDLGVLALATLSTGEGESSLGRRRTRRCCAACNGCHAKSKARRTGRRPSSSCLGGCPRID